MIFFCLGGGGHDHLLVTFPPSSLDLDEIMSVYPWSKDSLILGRKGLESLNKYVLW